MKPQDSKLKDRVGVIDVIAHEAKRGEVVLVMNETDEWNGSEQRGLRSSCSRGRRRLRNQFGPEQSLGELVTSELSALGDRPGVPFGDDDLCRATTQEKFAGDAGALHAGD